jgi:hypothetical protein
VEVAVSAMHEGSPLFTTTAQARFVQGRTAWLPMFLADRCRAGTDCGPDETCGLTGCEDVVRDRLPLERPGSTLWSVDFETGLETWTAAGLGETWSDQGMSVELESGTARSGTHSVRLSRPATAGGTSLSGGLRRWGEQPREARYGAWYFFPERYRPGLFWIIMAFGAGDPGGRGDDWVVDVGNDDSGDMYLYLWDAIDDRNAGPPLALDTIPVGRWTHVEVLVRHATDDTGRLALWLDGVKVYDFDRVQTASRAEHDWSILSDSDGIAPGVATFYVDDATITSVSDPTATR